MLVFVIVLILSFQTNVRFMENCLSRSVCSEEQSDQGQNFAILSGRLVAAVNDYPMVKPLLEFWSYFCRFLGCMII